MKASHMSLRLAISQPCVLWKIQITPSLYWDLWNNSKWRTWKKGDAMREIWHLKVSSLIAEFSLALPRWQQVKLLTLYLGLNRTVGFKTNGGVDWWRWWETFDWEPTPRNNDKEPRWEATNPPCWKPWKWNKGHLRRSSLRVSTSARFLLPACRSMNVRVYTCWGDLTSGKRQTSQKVANGIQGLLSGERQKFSVTGVGAFLISSSSIVARTASSQACAWRLRLLFFVTRANICILPGRITGAVAEGNGNSDRQGCQPTRYNSTLYWSLIFLPFLWKKK